MTPTGTTRTRESVIITYTTSLDMASKIRGNELLPTGAPPTPLHQFMQHCWPFSPGPV